MKKKQLQIVILVLLGILFLFSAVQAAQISEIRTTSVVGTVSAPSPSAPVRSPVRSSAPTMVGGC